MGSYFNFLIRKSGIQKKKTPKKPTVKKLIKDMREELKTKDPLDKYVDMPSSGGPSVLAAIAIAGLVGIVAIVMIAPVIITLNTTSNISVEATGMLELIPLLLVGAVILGIITAMTRVMM